MTWYYLVQAAYNVDALVKLVELSFVFEWVNPFTYSSVVDFLGREQVVDERQWRDQVRRLMVGGRRAETLAGNVGSVSVGCPPQTTDMFVCRRHVGS